MCIRDRKNPFDFKLSEVLENDTKEKVALTEEQEQALLSLSDVCQDLVKELDTIIIALDYELTSEYGYNKTVDRCV